MSYRDSSQKLKQDFQLMREEAQDLLYYLEGDILNKREKPEGWSILEILLHMNLLNAHYLKGIKNAPFPTLQSNRERSSWVGNMLLKSMGMQGEQPARKLPAPGKTNPQKKIAKGFPAVPHAIFGDFWNDLGTMEQEIDKAQELNYSRKKVLTLFWPLRLTGLEALQLLVLHSHRHLMQIKRILRA